MKLAICILTMALVTTRASAEVWYQPTWDETRPRASFGDAEPTRLGAHYRFAPAIVGDDPQYHLFALQLTLGSVGLSAGYLSTVPWGVYYDDYGYEGLDGATAYGYFTLGVHFLRGSAGIELIGGGAQLLLVQPSIALQLGAGERLAGGGSMTFLAELGVSALALRLTVCDADLEIELAPFLGLMAYFGNDAPMFSSPPLTVNFGGTLSFTYRFGDAAR